MKINHRELHSEITKQYPSFTLSPKWSKSRTTKEHNRRSSQQKSLLCENHSFDSSPVFFHSSLTRFDHLIAIERAGMAADGNYYNARKVNIKHLVDPIDELFLAARTIPGVTTTGISEFLCYIFRGKRSTEQELLLEVKGSRRQVLNH